ncbi:hypothetical protein NHX12_024477 [Muraenolepis orangiensis]|uniref:Uncharacterized protein n=1 Tax=Muraenolepis orangiensis TaxID=630683 RepID=A0A9Q0EKF6_9TELE|nr:hypothetical protein NHX12_024477 [Muraenolepis orangiensis]
MPSTNKILCFLSSALATSVSVGLLGFCMSIEWSQTTMACTVRDEAYENGTATITVALFELVWERSACPFGQTPPASEVFPELQKIGGAPQALHVLCMLLLVVCLVCSSGSILIALYNSVSNPYETYMGPIGIYVCSSVSGEHRRRLPRGGGLQSVVLS